MLSDDDDGIVVEALSSGQPDVASDFADTRVPRWSVIAGDPRRRLVRAALIRVRAPSLSATLICVVMANDQQQTDARRAVRLTDRWYAEAAENT
jgi:hypothetical protein